MFFLLEFQEHYHPLKSDRSGSNVCLNRVITTSTDLSTNYSCRLSPTDQTSARPVKLGWANEICLFALFIWWALLASSSLINLLKRTFYMTSLYLNIYISKKLGRRARVGPGITDWACGFLTNFNSWHALLSTAPHVQNIASEARLRFQATIQDHVAWTWR